MGDYCRSAECRFNWVLASGGIVFPTEGYVVRIPGVPTGFQPRRRLESASGQAGGLDAEERVAIV